MTVRLPDPPAKYDVQNESAFRRIVAQQLAQIPAAPTTSAPTVVSGSGSYTMKTGDTLVIVSGLTGAMTITLPAGVSADFQCTICRDDTTANGITIVPPAGGDSILVQASIQLGRHGDALRFTRWSVSGSGVWTFASAYGVKDYHGVPNVALNASGLAVLVQIALPDASRSVLGLAIQLNSAITAGTLAITMNVNGAQVGGTIITLSHSSNANGVGLTTLGVVFATGNIGNGGFVQLIATGAGLTGPTTATAMLRVL